MSDGSPQESEDADLRMINAKRMVELRKRANINLAKRAQEELAAKQPKAPTDRELLLKSLVERGDEVLTAAESSYPTQIATLIPQLSRLIREGKVKSISGGELLQFFRSLGLRVSVRTSISVQEHGRFVSIADKLRNQE
ncbi:MAG: double-stranded DNA-binding protein [Nitrososphaerota archaeon]|nr:double-stranded DNA-binding protein [Nitrososphaerota archaeon]